MTWLTIMRAGPYATGRVLYIERPDGSRSFLRFFGGYTMRRGAKEGGV